MHSHSCAYSPLQLPLSLSPLPLLLSVQRSESPKPPKPVKPSSELRLMLEPELDERTGAAELVRPDVTPRPGAGRRFALLRLFELNMSFSL
jgi:hypothetical protein